MKYIKKIVLFSLFLIIGCNNHPSIKLDFQSPYKPKENPILKADSTFTFVNPIDNQKVSWQKAEVFNPAAIVKDNKVFLLYRCEDNPAAGFAQRTSRIGLAYSDDGVHFTKYPTPVLYPDNDRFKQYDYPGGCEDPRVVQTEDGIYVMSYTSWNHKIARLSIAFSKDLVHWEKKGLAFEKALGGKLMKSWSKSGSMVVKLIDGKQVVTKINGKYWMYWGEEFINLAWSDNLIDWNPLLDKKGNLKEVVHIRKSKFDSRLVECGPPAILTDEGIILLYNGKNSEKEDSDTSLPKETYSVGKIVFDSNDMEKIVSRSDTPFLKPTLPHEKKGQYAAGTTFAEGLVYFKSKWFLYYGTADSYVGLAIFK